MKQLKKSKNNKKKGFTLVELIAVIAIIGILAAILVPTISGFITKSKKTKVVEQCRQYAMAVESVAAEGKLPTGTAKADLTITAAFGITEFVALIGDGATGTAAPTAATVFPKLPASTTYADAVDIAGGGTFTIDDNGVLNS